MTQPFRLGLTGSIAMGKSTTARMFADEGIPVWDADDAVHRLYSKGGAAVDPVRDLCPQAVMDGTVDRTRLSDWIAQDRANLAQLEAVVHPLVADDRARFIAGAKVAIVVLDIPLLFETGLEAEMDAVAVVSTTPEEQRRRALSRDGMTEERLGTILERQMPDGAKRARADYVIETSDLETARAQVKDVLRDIRGKTDAGNRARHGDNGIRPKNG